MTTFRNLGLCSLAATAALAIVGCNKTAEREPNADTSNMTPAARTRTAAEQISRARCEREQQCGNVGPDKTFSSSQDCVARIQTDWKDELNSRECPGGVNQQELKECMAQVRAEACANPFDTLQRITECTSGQICIEQP